ncbi:adenosine kinase [Roseiarcus fermentans]|uniref:Adenosine kinase n=1 Tax=Roseiarcus fermentans TaxID=1473586 RepID=A0A366FLR0_9HYPH|nr:adenosine kinase [Roseiarcus fermentans]RBP15527.1 adenosine kinase [Roseiarcus fermentans]
MTTTIEVLGLGNSLVDILAHADDAYLEAQDMAKGAMTLIDEDRAEALYAARVDPIVVSGGSAANTIVGVASLGVAAAYIGKVKSDPLGDAFIADIRSTGVRFDTSPAGHGPATGRCFVYVTPDGERTMNTYLGASTYLAPADVDEDLVRAAKVVYLEGYMWDRPAAKSAFQKAGTIAHAAGRRVALTLSDSFCVDRFRGEFIELMRSKTVDTIFANTDELLSLYETPHFEEALDALRAEGVLGVVTRSAKGCIVIEGEGTWEAPAFPIKKLVDTTGAGDMFAAGFLAGLARNLDMTACGRLGALAAAEIIQHLGARPQVPLAALAAEHGLTL